MSLDRQPLFRPKALQDRRRRLLLWLALGCAVLVIWGPRLSAPQPGIYVGQYDPLIVQAEARPSHISPVGTRLILRQIEQDRLTFRPEGPGDTLILNAPSLAEQLSIGQAITLHPLPGESLAILRGGEVIALAGDTLPNLLHRSAYPADAADTEATP